MFGKAKREAEHTEITEITPKAKKEKKPWDKARKKKVRRRVIAGVLTALVIVLFVSNSMMAKKARRW